MGNGYVYLTENGKVIYNEDRYDQVMLFDIEDTKDVWTNNNFINTGWDSELTIWWEGTSPVKIDMFSGTTFLDNVIENTSGNTSGSNSYYTLTGYTINQIIGNNHGDNYNFKVTELVGHKRGHTFETWFNDPLINNGTEENTQNHRYKWTGMRYWFPFSKDLSDPKIERGGDFPYDNYSKVCKTLEVWRDDDSLINGVTGTTYTTYTEDHLDREEKALVGGVSLVSDYNHDITGTTDIAASFWTYVPAGPVDRVKGIWALGSVFNRWNCFLNEYHEVILNTTGSSGGLIRPGSAMTTGWHHIVYNRIDGWTSLWIDGTFLRKEPDSANLPADKIIIGKWNNTNEWTDDMKLSNLILYNRSLSNNEISRLYNNT